jgi:hypothetical protein
MISATFKSQAHRDHTMAIKATYALWDSNTTGEMAFNQLRTEHNLRIALYKPSKKVPDPPLKWYPDRLQVGNPCLNTEQVATLLKCKSTEYLLEIQSVNPDGTRSIGRFPAPRKFFSGEQIIEDVNYAQKTYGNPGATYTYTRTMPERSKVGDDLYWSVWIAPEEVTQLNYDRTFTPPGSTRMGGYRPQQVYRMRCTIAPYYGSAGFLGLASVINRSRY